MATNGPTRLRDLMASAAAARRRRSRSVYLLALPILALVVVVLGYALLERMIFRPTVDSTVERTDMLVRAGERIQVDIVNACGVNGMAVRFTEFLRARHFDVPVYGTSAKREPFTKVIDRVGDPVSARKVAYALGVPPEHIYTEIDSSLFLRATVVIGDDYRSLRPMIGAPR